MTDEHQAWLQLCDILLARGVVTQKALDFFFQAPGSGEWAVDPACGELTTADLQAAELMMALERWAQAREDRHGD